MNDRLSMQDIAGILAEKTGKSKADAERFLRTFISVVSEGLMMDKLVKIKGLGTFKLVLVEQRESVDVNTGERFVLPAHYKCSFLPDTEMKELVNEPFSFFETIELSEGVNAADLAVPEDEGEQDEDTEGVSEEVKAAVVSIEQPDKVIKPEPYTGKAKKTPAAKPKTSPHRKVESAPAVTKAKETEPVAAQPVGRWRGLLSGVGFFLIVICGVFLYFYLGSGYVVHDEAEGVEPVIVDDPALLLQEETVEVIPEFLPEESLAIKEEMAVPFKEVRVVTVNENDRLTYLAEQYYGNRVFWVYIYQFNKTIIRNPDVIVVGMELILPDPAFYDIDATDSTSIQRARELEKEIKGIK